MLPAPIIVVAKLANVFDALKIQDDEYLDHWAPLLDVSSLMARARQQQ
jgi:hypothetical protein